MQAAQPQVATSGRFGPAAALDHFHQINIFNGMEGGTELPKTVWPKRS